MRRTTTFAADIRVLLCDNCGAPLESPLSGGSFACAYCRAQNVVRVRDERPTLGIPSVQAPPDEATRLAHLRSQDGRTPPLPPGLATLVQHGALDPVRVDEAFHVYQATRKEVRSTHSPDAAERLFRLTLLLDRYLASQRDDPRRRALLETSLDTLFLPRHLQVLRAHLAKAAAREGDLVGAERWLAPCDSRSVEIEADSAFRVARAYLDTARQDFRRVVEVLGSRTGEVPIHDPLDIAAAVLRANALERSGYLQPAIQMLIAAMDSRPATVSLAEVLAGTLATTHPAVACEAYVRENPQLALCPASLPQALAARSARRAQQTFQASGGAAGYVLIGIGACWSMVVLLSGVLTLDRHMTTSTLFATLPLTAAMFGAQALPSLGFLAGGMYLLSRAKQRARVVREGIRMPAVVRSINYTGLRINNRPQLRYTLEVTGPQGPFTAAENLLEIGLLPRLGDAVTVLALPETPHDVVMDLD